ncbi:MBL fold metallo-hydrolase [Sphaerochaeta globosa]|uniref:Beta-lactamase domain protein n=1 Tax=Sphaerochaeta globosa (strain ATCC BAA-1886 / DSM 22777 / Buddy) TaxID=158189 RepID=F0RRM4_SPHGB|nr:MBL fold metallo-hydrolase [Sphaerochaeta globosa]ADY14283.1 beta-lactamase domain protein [Sphaerochaeta globosa str. Buddy]
MLGSIIKEAQPKVGEIYFWWIGQSGFVLKTDSLCIVIDPYLSTTLEKATMEQSWKRHIRMMDILIEPIELSKVDYILISHEHRDHYDQVTVSGILSSNPACTVIASKALAQRIKAEQNCRVISLDDGQHWDENGLTIDSIRAKHNNYDQKEETGFPYLSYAIRLSSHTLFFAGDTIPHPPLEAFLSSIKPEMAFLPINGYTQELLEKGFASNLTYLEAINLALKTNVEIAIPCHYDMFTINTEQVGRFVNEANKQGLSYLIPTVNDTYILEQGGTIRWILH